MGAGVLLQQGGSTNDLAGLAVAALGNLELHPGRLHGVQGDGRRAQALDRGDGTADGADRRHARAHRGTDHMDGARAALRNAAAELVPGRFSSSRSTHSGGISGSTSILWDFPLTVSFMSLALSVGGNMFGGDFRRLSDSALLHGPAQTPAAWPAAPPEAVPLPGIGKRRDGDGLTPVEANQRRINQLSHLHHPGNVLTSMPARSQISVRVAAGSTACT